MNRTCGPLSKILAAGALLAISLGGAASAAEQLQIAVIGGNGMIGQRIVRLKDPSGQLILERVPPERKPEHLGQKAALDYYSTVRDASWTYLSPPGSIMPGERTGVFRLGGDALMVNDKGESRITMEDYAVAILDEAENPRHVGRRFTVGY